MKKILLILLMLLQFHLMAQKNDSLSILVNSVLTGKEKIPEYENYKLINKYDAKDLQKSLDYLSHCFEDSLLRNNISNLKDVLCLYTYHENQSIRKRALNLFLDVYRLTSSSQYSFKKIQKSDLDKNLKKRILGLLSDITYSNNEKEFLKEREKKRIESVYDDDYLLHFVRVDTTQRKLSEIRDSMIQSHMIDTDRKLSHTPNCQKELLSHLCATYYIYESIPYLKKYLANSHSQERIKLDLARLKVEEYEDEILKMNFDIKFFNYHNLFYINTEKSKRAMIDGLRMEGRDRGTITAWNSNHELVTFETDGPLFKVANLKEFKNNYNFTIEFPFLKGVNIDQYDDSFVSKCEEVAKWMEDNFDKLEINPDFRY